jgi:hypothetical protein
LDYPGVQKLFDNSFPASQLLRFRQRPAYQVLAEAAGGHWMHYGSNYRQKEVASA